MCRILIEKRGREARVARLTHRACGDVLVYLSPKIEEFEVGENEAAPQANGC
jgi:hypothetical protein